MDDVVLAETRIASRVTSSSASRWPTASIGVLSAAIFAALMLVVTGVHWGTFDHGDAPVLAAPAGA